MVEYVFFPDIQVDFQYVYPISSKSSSTVPSTLFHLAIVLQAFLPFLIPLP